MSDANQVPMVVAAPGIVANDGHDHFASPRNIIAFAIILLFGAIELIPYWVTIPPGRNGDLILQGAKTVEVIVMLVLSFFFATTVNAARKDVLLQNQQAATAAARGSAPDPATRLVIDPPATITVKDDVDAPKPDARSGPGEAANPPEATRLQPRDDGPAE